MATHKSAIKRHRQNLKRRVRNITIKSAIKTAIKQVKDNIASGNAEKAKASLAKKVKSTTLSSTIPADCLPDFKAISAPRSILKTDRSSSVLKLLPCLRYPST